MRTASIGHGLASLAMAIALGGATAWAQAAGAPPPAVLVAKASLRELQRQTEYVGRVQAIEKVDVRARVTGFLIARDYKEGSEVKKGDVLFLIDPSQFQATLAQRQAALASAEAAALNAEQQLKRSTELARTDFGTRQALDIRTAEDAKAKADVLGAKAQITLAEIDLGYTKISSPIDGQAGPAALTTGNLVGPDSGVLATIVSQDPIYVQFPVSVRELETIREARRKEGGELAKIEIRVRLPNGAEYPERGVWNLTDPQVDQQTDTLIMRATIANPDRQLTDGQFVTAIIRERQEEPRLVVPQAALQIDQSGYYVLVVDDQQKVEQRRIQTGPNQDTEVVITSGLRDGENVIVDGIQKVHPGQLVEATKLAPAGG